jgi:hypothetical protein
MACMLTDASTISGKLAKFSTSATRISEEIYLKEAVYMYHPYQKTFPRKRVCDSDESIPAASLKHCPLIEVKPTSRRMCDSEMVRSRRQKLRCAFKLIH